MQLDPVLEKYTKHYEDLWYYVQFELYEGRLECVVHPVYFIADGGIVYFRDEADRFGTQGTTDLNLAEKFVSGYVKWDGCSNWKFHNYDVMHHFCRRDQLGEIGTLMTRLYDEAAAKIPTFSD